MCVLKSKRHSNTRQYQKTKSLKSETTITIYIHYTYSIHGRNNNCSFSGRNNWVGNVSHNVKQDVRWVADWRQLKLLMSPHTFTLISMFALYLTPVAYERKFAIFLVDVGVIVVVIVATKYSHLSSDDELDVSWEASHKIFELIDCGCGRGIARAHACLTTDEESTYRLALPN